MTQLPANSDAPRQAYSLLWMCYCADGAVYGASPAGVARWAYLQALPHVCPATAARIAQGVLAAAQAGDQADSAAEAPGPQFPDMESFQAFFG